jgi:hypothetical protein
MYLRVIFWFDSNQPPIDLCKNECAKNNDKNYMNAFDNNAAIVIMQ